MTGSSRRITTAQKRSALRVFLLGGLEFEFRSERTRPEWRLRKAASIVKLLALAPHRSMHRDHIIDLLWPDASPDAGLNNFYQALHVARRTVGDILETSDTAELPSLDNQVVTLAPRDGIWVDVDAFERAADRAFMTRDQADHYAALNMYQGDLLPEDRYEDWTEPRRQQLAEVHLNLMLNLAHIHEEQGNAQVAIDLYWHVVEQEPALEHAHVQLMRLYAGLGRPRQALRQFERLSKAVRREFDSAPGEIAEQVRQAIQQDSLSEPGLSVSPDLTAPAQVMGPNNSDQSQISFIGRQSELRFLSHQISRLQETGLQIVLVHGDTGIGKSRLAREVADIASKHGNAIAWGHCYEWEGAFAYWPWVEIIRTILDQPGDEAFHTSFGSHMPAIVQVIPDLRWRLPEVTEAPQVAPDRARLKFFEGVCELIRAISAVQPQVIVIDDLHWADHSSLLLLEFIVREMHDAAVLLLITYRDEPTVPVNRALVQVLGNLARFDNSQAVGLQPLRPPEIGKLIEVLTGMEPPARFVKEMQVRTEGNPFFITEIVRMLSSESSPHELDWRISIPQSVQEVIDRRLGPLPSNVRALLDIAAVIGRDFDTKLLAAVSGLSAGQVIEQLDVAVPLHIVEEQDEFGHYRFSHALVQQVLYAAMRIADRMQTHWRVAATIELTHASRLETQYGELAWHYSNAAALGHHDKAIEHSLTAGGQAMEKVAWETALGHFERAYKVLEMSDSRDDAQACDILLALGEAQDRVGVGRGSVAGAGNDPVAISTYRNVAAIARQNSLPEMLARAALGVAGLSLGGQHGGDEGTILMQEALESLPDEDSELRVQLLARLARGLHLGSVLDGHVHSPSMRKRIEAWGNQSIAMARRLNDPATLIEALAAKPVMYRGPMAEVDQTLNVLEEVLRLSTSTRNPERIAWALFAKHEALVQKGETGAARLVLDELEVAAAKTEMPVYHWFGTVARTGDALRRGKYADAERYIKQSGAIWPNSNMAAWQEFTLRREQNRLDDVLELHHKRFREQNIPQNRSYWLVCLVENGQLADARALLRIIAETDLDTLPPTTTWLRSLALISEACTMLENQPYAHRLYELLSPYALHNLTLGYTDATGGAVAHYLGLLAACNEQWEVAESHFLQALDLHDAWDMPPYVAHSSYACAVMLQRRNQAGDRARIHALADNALEIAVELDMEALKQRVRSMKLYLQSA